MEYNPLSREMAEDPYPTYRWLRDEAPVYHHPTMDFYALSRFDDVLRASLDGETFFSGNGTTIEGLERGMNTLLTRDGEEHRTSRLVVTRRFKPSGVASLEPRIREVAAGLLDQARDAGEIDLVTGFSAKLPMVVIAELMALPVEQRDRIHELCDQMLSRDGADETSMTVPEPAAAAGAELLQLLMALAAERRAHPGDDVASLLATSVMVDASGSERPLEDWELATRYLELAIAGHETVMKLVSTGALRLEQFPAARAALVADPRLIPNAVEEMLRIDPPSQYQGRWTSREVTLHGTTVPADVRVLLLTGAATRDERAYPDPDQLDIHRVVGRQIGFGYGVHLCLGAALARLEARVAFEELLARFPAYEVDTEHAVRSYSSNVRGYSSMPVRLEPHRVPVGVG
jgi:cytochrome P450